MLTLARLHTVHGFILLFSKNSMKQWQPLHKLFESIDIPNMHILVNNKSLCYQLNPFTNFKKYSLFLLLAHHSLLGPVKFTASPLWHCKNTPKSPVNPSCCQCPFFFLSNLILVHCPAGFHSVEDFPFFEICGPLVPCPPFLASCTLLFCSLILP